MWELLGPLLAGARVVLAAVGGQRDTEYLVRTMAAEEISIVHFGPSMLQVVLQEPGLAECRSLRQVFCGGEALSVELAAQFGQRLGASLHHQYGPTETTVDVCVWDCERVVERERVPIGRPIANTEVYILDEQQRAVPVGVRGELYVGGVSVARGYLQQPGLTAARFVPHPYSRVGGARLYRTGDLGRYLAGGEIEFLGRADEQVKLRGYRIEPGEIETVLKQHVQVEQAVVVLEEEDGEKQLVAYVVWAGAGAEPMLRGGLREYLRQRLPEYMVPARFVQLTKLPLTPNGKVDRKALAPLGRVLSPTAATANETLNPIEGLLANLWAELLKVDEVSINDSFFDLGGHSLLATRLISRVREVFHVEIPLRSLFETPTIAGFARTLAATIQNETGSKSLPLTPIEGDTERPLSYAQQRLWFLDRLQPDSSFYNLPGAVRLTGELDLIALQRSLQEIIQRHDVLRSSFDDVDGRPVQTIAASVVFDLPITDLEHLPVSEREAEAQRLLIEEAGRPFDLTRGPVLRASLVRIASQSHLLLITMHHIISDAWSMGVFIRELTAGYEAFRAGTPLALSELTIQYPDYAYWQQQRLQDHLLQNQVDYWRKQLSDAPTLLALPTDRPRPAVQTFRGTLRSFDVPHNLSRDLRELSRREGVTLFMTLLAAFYVLLKRYSGQSDIVVGTPIAGRNHAATEKLIGFFLNMLVLRTDLGGNPTVRQLLGRVREVALGAYTHQEVPFEKLVEDLAPERSLSHSPLFQVMFTLDNTPQESLTLAGLQVELASLESQSAKYDLTFALEEKQGQLRLKIEYNTSLFDEDTIVRMASHYERLLEGLVANPEKRISELPLLGQEEWEEIVVRWNATEAEELGRSVAEEFEKQVARTPNEVAVVYEAATLSYRELNERANQLAHYLRGQGVGAETLVGVCMERSLGMVVGMLGVLKAGGAYVPLDPQYPEERVKYQLADGGVKVVVTEGKVWERFVGYEGRVVYLDREWEEVKRESRENPVVGSGRDNLAYVIYTSGSTGTPKGVSVCHGNVLNFFAAMDRRIGDDEPGTWLALTSISFDISVLELFWTLARGYKVIIQGEQVRESSPAGGAIQKREERGMQFSLFYFASDENRSGEDIYRLLIEGAKFADQNGFTAVWTPERHFHAFGGLYANPSVTSAAIATVTQRISIRAGSVVIPLHDPIRVAEEWAMVDNLSHGRVAISFASGWHANDFVLAADTYTSRHEVMYRNIEILRQLWRGESIVRRDGAGKEIAVKIHPHPIQRELPIWITAAGSPETFKTAGRMGANLLTHLLGQTVEELVDKIAIYRAAWQEHGHGPGNGHITLMLHTFISKDLEEVREKVRVPFCNYLRSAVNLLRNSARSLGHDLDSQKLTEEDMEAILSHAFGRYFETSALLGTPASALQMIEKLKAAGVDEVACLIDFGVPDEEVLSSLSYLNVLRERSNSEPTPIREDYSIAAQIARHRVTHLQCTPSMARMLLSDPESLHAMQSLNKLLVGGEALPVPVAQQLRQTLTGTIHNMYGPTETTIWSTSYQIDRVEGSIPIGTPVANNEIRILDENFQPVPIGVVGELYIGGKGVVRSYLQQAGLTAERFVPDPFARATGARMYRTGDLARYLSDGNIEFHGRTDRQVKISGHRVETGEIEAVLREQPGVREAVVLARGDEAGDHRLLAYIVPDGDGDFQRLKMVPKSEAERLLGDQSHFELPNGMVVAHPSGHRASILYQEIFANQTYFRHGITLHDGDTVFDVGANVGIFTLFVNSKRSNLNLYAFEPIPPTFERLRTNVSLYGLNARLFNLGLSSESGKAEFTFYPKMPGLSGRYATEGQNKQDTKAILQQYLRERGSEQEREILTDDELNQLMGDFFQSETYSCSLTTLSQIINEHKVERIDLLKVDVERSEFDVLSGLSPEDWTRIRQIVVEVDTKELLGQITALLDQHHFTFAVDELINVERDEAGIDVHVYMLYAKRPEESRSGTEAVPELLSVAGNGALSVRQLRKNLQDKLPAYMIPSSFTLLSELPLTPNGKVDLHALPEPGEPAAEMLASYVAPKTRAEQIIAESWRQVLQLRQVGVNDNFFEVGGTSLRLVQVNSKLRQAFNRSIPVVEMFRHPTISDLARYLGAEEEEKPGFEHIQERAGKRAGALNRQAQAIKAKRKKDSPKDSPEPWSPPSRRDNHL